MAQVMVGEFEIPAIVDEMLALGSWPSDNRDWDSRVPAELVRAVLPDEDCFCLEAPPFTTIEENQRRTLELGLRGVWFERFRHPDEIDYAKAVVIADFGWGSDNPIVLDYRHSPPQVMAVTFEYHRDDDLGSGEWEGHWVVIAPSLEELLNNVGLL
jgi:hypothetical protein